MLFEDVERFVNYFLAYFLYFRYHNQNYDEHIFRMVLDADPDISELSIQHRLTIFYNKNRVYIVEDGHRR